MAKLNAFPGSPRTQIKVKDGEYKSAKVTLHVLTPMRAWMADSLTWPVVGALVLGCLYLIGEPTDMSLEEYLIRIGWPVIGFYLIRLALYLLLRKRRVVRITPETIAWSQPIWYRLTGQYAPAFPASLPHTFNILDQHPRLQSEQTRIKKIEDRVSMENVDKPANLKRLVRKKRYLAGATVLNFVVEGEEWPIAEYYDRAVGKSHCQRLQRVAQLFSKQSGNRIGSALSPHEDWQKSAGGLH